MATKRQPLSRAQAEYRPAFTLSRYVPQLLAAPSVIFILLLFVFPALYLGYLSVFESQAGVGGRLFVGLRNFRDLFADPRFLPYFGNTLLYVGGSVYLGLIVQMGIALTLNIDLRFSRLFRSLILIPWAVPSVVSALSWKWIFDFEYGVLNYFLTSLGMIESPIFWLGSYGTAMAAIMIADFWTYSPFVIVTLISGLKSIPPDLYEAARIDGATPTAQFFHITLPLLRPVLLVVVITRTLFAFRALDYVFVLTGGGPGNATQVLSSWLYSEGFNYLNLSFAAAIGLVMVSISAVLVVSLYFLFRPRFDVS